MPHLSWEVSGEMNSGDSFFHQKFCCTSILKIIYGGLHERLWREEREREKWCKCIIISKKHLKIYMYNIAKNFLKCEKVMLKCICAGPGWRTPLIPEFGSQRSTASRRTAGATWWDLSANKQKFWGATVQHWSYPSPLARRTSPQICFWELLSWQYIEKNELGGVDFLHIGSYFFFLFSFLLIPSKYKR